MAKVEIYTREFCPYCERAIKLLRAKKVSYTEYEKANRAEIRSEMVKRANGANTFPQIFIDGKHVGGCDDLHALDARGGLDPLLRA
ncbi:MAG TPA: glutaredoxin 3 [Hyphomonadaceae bacterium]|nr:glutaredoxin 3 [Hyphomonadaceae bacterium]